MENVQMDKLEWVDVILIALFPLLGIILYFVHKNNEEDERAQAALYATVLAIIIYIPLTLLLGYFGTLIGFAILVCVFYMNTQGKLPVSSGAYSGHTDTRSTVAKERPAFCTNCGGDLSKEELEWLDNNTVRCPFCGSNISV
jgi:hypothetical protein